VETKSGLSKPSFELPHTPKCVRWSDLEDCNALLRGNTAELMSEISGPKTISDRGDEPKSKQRTASNLLGFL